MNRTATEQRLEPSERRRDERRQRWPPLSRQFWLGGERRRARRSGDRGHTHADLGPRLGLAVTAVLAGSLLDAMLTLVLLQRGASEANPLMAATLSLGVINFIAIKLGTTTLATVLLAIHHHRCVSTHLPVTWVITGLAAIYTGVIAWELWLLAWLPAG